MDETGRQFQSICRDISLSLSTYENFASQLRSSTLAISSLQDSVAKQLALDRNMFRDASSILSHLRAAQLATSNFRDLAIANQNLTRLVSTAAVASSSLSQVFAEHNALRKSFAALALQPSVTDLLSSLDTTRLLDTSFSTQYRLLQLEATSFGQLIRSSPVLTNDLTATFSKLTRSYRDVIGVLPKLPQMHIPLVAKYSPVEYSLELDVLERISVESDEQPEREELPSIDDELASFDGRLLRLVSGAREALKSDNPDKARHVTTSVRELFTQILHGLAPDEELRKWSQDESHYHNHRPTRRARLLYICRKFSCDPLTQFVEDDVRAALTLVDSLNAGTHVVESALTHDQLSAIVYRMESLAVFLLKIARNDQ